MDFKPISGRDFPRFSAINTFFRLPQASLSQEFDVALFGTPFDGAVSYRPGCRFGPARVREASSLGRGFHWSRGRSFFDHIRVADIGDCPTVPIDIQQTYERIESFAMDVLQSKKRFISVGGDHSTTLPLLRAVRKHYGKSLNLIHFDAHLDTYPAAWGCEYHHGAFVRHAIEEHLVEGKNVYQFGIRGPLAAGSDLDFVNKHNIQVTTVDDLRMKGLAEFLKSSLPDLNDHPTYISFDIDCLDPAFAPGTGTPVVGGLTTYETQQILRNLKIPNLVAADIVEISPPFDQSEITCLAGVDTLFEILHLMA